MQRNKHKSIPMMLLRRDGAVTDRDPGELGDADPLRFCRLLFAYLLGDLARACETEQPFRVRSRRSQRKNLVVDLAQLDEICLFAMNFFR